MSKKKETALKLTLRLLNSGLRGCEFHLPAGKTLFLVKAESDILSLSGMPDLPEDAIYIPLAEGGLNFEVLLTEPAASAVTIRILAPGDIKEINYVFNTVCKVGNLEFAIKPIDEPWGAQVLAHERPAVAPVASLPPPVLVEKPKFPTLLIGAILLLAGALFGASRWWTANPQQQANELSMLLTGSVENLQILVGRDGVFYVFANSERDATWAKQTLARSPLSKPVKVMTYREEAARIGQQLELDNPLFAYYVLRFEQPGQAKLFFSYERVLLNAAGRDSLTRKMMQWLPYATKIELVPVADADVVRQAKLGLDNLGVPYAQINHSSGTTFLIEGALEDIELQKARTFVDAFYRQWGDHYVQFSVALKDDPLKGKSFLSGSQGYVKMAPSHWYFPKTL